MIKFYLGLMFGVKCFYWDWEHGPLYRWQDPSGDLNSPNDWNPIPDCFKGGRYTSKRLSNAQLSKRVWIF